MRSAFQSNPAPADALAAFEEVRGAQRGAPEEGAGANARAAVQAPKHCRSASDPELGALPTGSLHHAPGKEPPPYSESQLPNGRAAGASAWPAGYEVGASTPVHQPLIPTAGGPDKEDDVARHGALNGTHSPTLPPEPMASSMLDLIPEPPEV